MTATAEDSQITPLETTDHVKSRLDEIRSDMLEMAQLKSDFDCDKFTRAKEGPFLAHQFHFIMRQYSLALYELRRMLIEAEKHRRTIRRYEDDPNSVPDGEFADLLILQHQNEIELLELSMINKKSICDNCERMRQELIQRNGGSAPTNKDYQAEEPTYWKWFLQRQALIESKQSATGISAGTWLNIEHLEQPAMLDESFRVSMGLESKKGLLNLTEALRAIEESKSRREVSAGHIGS